MNYPTVTELLPYAAGYFISLFVAHFLIQWTHDPLWRSIGNLRKKEWYLTSLNQGFLERLLYTLSWQIEQPAFIGIWFVLKVASKWKRWSEDSTYNIFLVGTGLSVLYSTIGYMEITWIQKCNWQAVGIPLIVIIANLLLIWFNNKKNPPLK